MGPTTVCRWLPERAVVDTYVHNLLKYSRLIHGCHPDSREVLAGAGETLQLPTLSNVDLNMHKLVHYCPSLRTTPIAAHGIKEITVESLDPIVQEFQDFIGADAEVLMYFNQMFDQAPPPEGGEQRKIENYLDLMQVINTILRVPPSYGGDEASSQAAAVPFYAVISRFCNTPAGFNAFINPGVNARFHNIFFKWQTMLELPDSKSVLNRGETGWFNPNALNALVESAGGDPKEDKFEDFYDCDPEDPSYGYNSFDHFFVREMRPEKLDPKFPGRCDFINAACTSTIRAIYSPLKESDKFWIKQTPYSLRHVLGNDDNTDSFIGGTMFQALLASRDYHRWRSPVDGVVKKTRLIPGTYYATLLDDDDGSPDDPLTRSQDFVTAISTRALIFIESDNKDIGLVCFVGVGLAEVSTCNIVAQKGQRLKKGDELGQFHFGGSTHCLIFGPQVKLTPFHSVNEKVYVGDVIFEAAKNEV